MMTVGLLAVVVYLYTVVAFNFFRKFYNKSEDEDEPDMKCDDMMTVSDSVLVLTESSLSEALLTPLHSVTCSTCMLAFALVEASAMKSRTQPGMNTNFTGSSLTSPSSSLSLSSC